MTAAQADRIDEIAGLPTFERFTVSPGPMAESYGPSNHFNVVNRHHAFRFLKRNGNEISAVFADKHGREVCVRIAPDGACEWIVVPRSA